MTRSLALGALFIRSILALQPSSITEGQVPVYPQYPTTRKYKEGFVNTTVESRSTDTHTDTHDLGRGVLPYFAHDPIQSYPTAIVLMVLSMALVIGLGFACMLVTGSSERSCKDTAARPPSQMLTLDFVRVAIVADIIFRHTAHEWSFLAKPGLDGLFVISGFVLVMSADSKTGNFDVPAGAAFIIRRLARLCPGYYIALGWTAAFIPPQLRAPYSAWPVDALFLKTLAPFYVGEPWKYFPFAGMGHGWFVSMVMIHALLFPFMYNFMKMQASSWSTWVFFFMSSVGLHWGSSFLKHTSFDVLANHHFALGYRLLVFFMGMLSAQLTSMAPPAVLLHNMWWFILIVSLPLALDLKVLQRWFRLEDIGFVTAPVLMWSVVVIAGRCVAEQSAMEQSSDENRNMHFSCAWQLRGLFSQCMTCLAKYSYGAYLYQYVASNLLSLAWRERPVWADFLIVVLAWLLAVASEHFVEKPVVRATEVQLRRRTISHEGGAGITKD